MVWARNNLLSSTCGRSTLRKRRARDTKTWDRGNWHNAYVSSLYDAGPAEFMRVGYAFGKDVRSLPLALGIIYYVNFSMYIYLCGGGGEA